MAWTSSQPRTPNKSVKPATRPPAASLRSAAERVPNRSPVALNLGPPLPRAMDRREGVALALFVGGTLAVGLLSGLAAARAPEDYARLESPPWAPPAWVFGPVWSILYVFIGVAGWLVWRAGAPRTPLALWGTQLALNVAWTPIFFGLGMRGLALVDIGVLLVLVAATMVAFLRVHRTAGWLLAPYLAWVGFATALNAAYWWLNR